MRKRRLIGLLTLAGVLCFVSLAQAMEPNSFVQVPEPGSMLLLGSALAGVAAAYRKLKK